MLTDGVREARFTRYKAKAHVVAPPLSFVNDENYETVSYTDISAAGFF